jgi:hypothetical protein
MEVKWMRRGVVLELKDQYVIVLAEGNKYIKIKKKLGMKEGQVIYFFDDDLVEEHFSNVKKYIAMVAVLAILLVGIRHSAFDIFKIGNDLILPKDVYAVVSIDINPSIELELSENLSVKNAYYKNEEAKNLFSNDSLENKYYTLAIKDIITLAREDGYLSKDGAIMVSATINDEKLDANSELYNDIKRQIESIMTQEDDVSLVMVEGNLQDLKFAREEKTSLGKATIIHSMSDLTAEDKEEIKREKVKTLILDGKINDSNSELEYPSKNRGDALELEIPTEDQFITIIGNEYIDIEKLIGMGFDLDLNIEEGQGKVQRGEKEITLESKYLFAGMEGRRYILLKNVFDGFSIEYNYEGCDLRIKDGGKEFYLYYGNPGNKQRLEKKIKRWIYPMKLNSSRTEQIETSISDLIVIDGSEWLRKEFLEEKGFSFEKNGSNSLKVFYLGEERDVEVLFEQRVNDKIYYPAKEILELYGLKFRYKDANPSIFEIEIDGQIYDLKYEKID